MESQNRSEVRSPLRAAMPTIVVLLALVLVLVALFVNANGDSDKSEGAGVSSIGRNSSISSAVYGATHRDVGDLPQVRE